MATMNVSLPDQMKHWAEEQTTDGRYANVSDYVRDLIRRDQERAEARAELQAIIDKSVASGMGTRSMDEIKTEARRRFG